MNLFLLYENEEYFEHTLRMHALVNLVILQSLILAYHIISKGELYKLFVVGAESD